MTDDDEIRFWKGVTIALLITSILFWAPLLWWMLR